MTVYPTQSDLEINLLSSLHHTEFLTYALVMGEELKIVRSAPNFMSFLGEKSDVDGYPLTDVFVEFIGSEAMLRSVMHGDEAMFSLEYIARENKDRTLHYYTTEVRPYQGIENALLLLLIDTTVAGRLQQRLTQERNELAYEVQRHEITQMLLKDTRDELARRVTQRSEDLEKTNAALEQEIEERKQIEADLLQAQKMEAIGALAGGIAHDFNNWLTVINTYSSQMMKMYGDEERILKYSKQINQAGKQASLLTNQLLTFSRKQVSQPTLVDINERVVDVSTLVERSLGERVTVDLNLDDNLPLVKIDEGQLTQVLINLLVNAKDAMPSGGIITLTSKLITDEQSEQGEMVHLAITDNGEGMNDVVKSRIFEPFFTTKDVGKGTGLGLSTAYGIIAESGGHIIVDSALGEGTTFNIYLPKAVGRSDKPSDNIVERIPADTTILVVDDTLEVLNLVYSCLGNAGYTMLAANSGQEAIEMAQNEQINLLVTDVVMPDLNGKQVAERIREMQGNHIQTLYMSGFSHEIITNKDIELDKNRLLMKPFTPEQLVDAVKQALVLEQST